MTASSNKVQTIRAQMDSLEMQMAEIRAQATRQMLDLEEQVSRLRGELSSALVDSNGTPRPVPLKVATRTHTLEVVTPRKYTENLFKKAVGDVKKWAADNEVSYSSAKGWVSQGKPVTRRKIPRKWADFFLANHGIPYDFWPWGITEGYPDRDD